jgi:hypothetical protein
MFKFLQPASGTAYERKAASSSTRLTPREQLAENIRKQKQLFQATAVRQPDGRIAHVFNGQEVLSREGGSPVKPLWTRHSDGVVTISAKFGGQLIELLPGEKTLRTPPAVDDDTVAASFNELIDAVCAGAYDDQLERISAEISKKLRGEKKPDSGNGSTGSASEQLAD